MVAQPGEGRLMRDLRASLAALEAVALLLKRLAMMHPCWVCRRAATVRGYTDQREPRLACDAHIEPLADVVDLRGSAAVRAGIAALSSGGDA